MFNALTLWSLSLICQVTLLEDEKGQSYYSEILKLLQYVYMHKCMLYFNHSIISNNWKEERFVLTS